MVWLGAMALVLCPAAAWAQQAADCLACHGVEGFASQSGKKLYVKESAFKASVHSSLACIACHTDARSIPHASRLKKVSCATCHVDVSTDVATGAHKALVSGRETSSSCIACHGAHEVSPPKQKPVALCATCHASETATYEKSVHGQDVRRGASDVASCEDCHGPAHKLRPASDPASSVYKTNLPHTCGTCHANPGLVAKYHIRIAKPLEAYQNSVHGKAIQAGRDGAAVCSDCHGSHGLFAAGDPRSQVFRANVPATCGRCHTDIWKTFQTSIHGQAVARGVTGAPVCTDCHGEHNILAPAEHGSTVSAAGIRLTCSRCHADERLVAKYGLPAEKVPTYEDTYHGLAARSGSVSVANCASCHGVHDIRPSSEPLSRINKRNLAATCGQCHPNAGARFALGPVHVVATRTSSRAVYWVRWFYLWLIIGTIGGMVLHNLADFLRKLISGYEVHHGRPIERMGLNFRLQHGLVTVSFVMLVLTGFALKFPESWWAAPLLRWEAQHAVRGTLHRIFAVVLIGAFVYHAIYLAVNRKARQCLRAILPARQDMYDVIGQVRYYLGLAREKPLFGKFNYIEKSEYWALAWCVFVMTISGFLLWFENFTLRNFPSWVADVATAVHFYEAILAGLAILVWHFYFTIFDPEVYPMEKSWLTGKVSGPRWERLAADEELRAAGQMETDSAPRPAETPAVGEEPARPGDGDITPKKHAR